MVRVIIKIAGLLSLLVGVSVLGGIASAYWHGFLHITVTIDFLLAIQALLLGLPCLYFAWVAWFGAILAFFALEELLNNFQVGRKMGEWITPGGWHGFAPLGGLVLALILLVGPFYFAARVHLALKSWLLKRV